MNKLKTQLLSFVLALFCMGAALLLFSCASAPSETEPDGTEVTEDEGDEAESAVSEDAAVVEEEDVSEEEELVEEIEPEEEVFSEYAFAQRLSELLDAGDFAAALACFDELEEPEASDVELLKLKLSILISSGDREGAAALADSLEANLGKDDPDILYARAVIALAENKPAERDKYLKQIIKVDPGNTEALISLGDDSLRKKAYGDAGLWYARALASDAGNPDAHRGLVHSYYLQGRMRDARKAVDRALALHPDNAALHVESALVYSEDKDLPAALDEMRMAVSLDPEVASYWSTYGVLLVRASKLTDARDALSEAIRLDPDNAFPYLYRCGVNDTLGFIDEAIADYRVVCQRYPQYYFAAEGLGTLLWIKGDFRGAKSAFAQAFKYADDNVSYALMITLCCYKLGENEEAKRFIGKFMNTLDDRRSPEYFVCRLFYDRSGDADVVGRISRVKDAGQRSKLMFYVAVYYELFQSESLALKFYSDIASGQAPACFEHRLAYAAVEAQAQSGVSQSPKGAR